MAVTIEQEPSPWQTTDNPVTYQFSSDEAGQPNFTFKVELKIDFVVVYTDKIFVERGNSAHFDASETIKFLVAGPQIKTALTDEAGTTRSIQLVVTENYGDPATDEASGSSSVTKVFKARVSDREFLTNDYNGDYKLKKWFTDHPTNNMQVLRSEGKLMTMLGGGDSAALTMKFYDASGILLHTHVTPNEVYQVWSLNLSTDNLTATALVPDITLVSYYTLQIESSDILTITYFDDACYLPVSIRWLNKYGGYDSFIFAHANIESGSVKASNYSKQFGQWVGSDYVYTLEDTGLTDYFKSNIRKGKLVSLYMDQELQNWLTSIYMGLKYSLTFEDGTSYPIRVSKTTYALQNRRFEDLINEQVDYEISTSDNTMTI